MLDAPFFTKSRVPPRLCRLCSQLLSMRLLHTQSRAAPLLRHAAPAAYRLASGPVAFGKGEAGEDPKKCPFMGGPNGGGLGDFNLLTAGTVLVAVIGLRLVLRRGLPRLAGWLGARRPLALLAAILAVALPAALRRRGSGGGGEGEFDMPAPAAGPAADDAGPVVVVEMEAVAPVTPAPPPPEIMAAPVADSPVVHPPGTRWSAEETERLSAAELSKVREMSDDPANPALALREAGGEVRLAPPTRRGALSA